MSVVDEHKGDNRSVADERDLAFDHGKLAACATVGAVLDAIAARTESLVADAFTAGLEQGLAGGSPNPLGPERAWRDRARAVFAQYTAQFNTTAREIADAVDPPKGHR